MRRSRVLLAAIWLAGCASEGTIYRDSLSELVVGRTTSAELARSWGPPLRDDTLADGRHIVTYQYVDSTTSASASFAPGFGPSGDAMDSVTGKVTLTFDPQGVLLDYAISGRS